MRRALGSPVLEPAARLLTPFILTFAAYVVAHGHSSPGGGFQGGVLLAAAVILVRLVRRDRAWGLSRHAALAAACAGTGLFVVVGLAALPFAGRYLDYGALPLPLAPASVRALGSLTVEIGIALGVMGVMVVVFDTLVRPGGED